MTNYSVGHEAEKVAARYIEEQGFVVRDLNWSTRLCEIDIVAEFSKSIYFIEVKYRSGDKQGSGIEYITPSKFKQMRFAADCWIAENKYTGDYCLSAIEVSGDFKVTEFIESIT